MLAARERMGLSQKQLADLAGVKLKHVFYCEQMAFGKVANVREKVERMASTLDVDVASIMPPELEEKILKTTHVRMMDVDPLALEGLQRTLVSALPAPSAELEGEELREEICKGLSLLTHREREVLKLRYGLDHANTYTFEEVGRIFKLTGERVRQIELKAIRKLQSGQILHQTNISDWIP